MPVPRSEPVRAPLVVLRPFDADASSVRSVPSRLVEASDRLTTSRMAVWEAERSFRSEELATPGCRVVDGLIGTGLDGVAVAVLDHDDGPPGSVGPTR